MPRGYCFTAIDTEKNAAFSGIWINRETRALILDKNGHTIAVLSVRPRLRPSLQKYSNWLLASRLSSRDWSACFLWSIRRTSKLRSDHGACLPYIGNCRCRWSTHPDLKGRPQASSAPPTSGDRRFRSHTSHMPIDRLWRLRSLTNGPALYGIAAPIHSSVKR